MQNNIIATVQSEPVIVAIVQAVEKLGNNPSFDPALRERLEEILSELSGLKQIIHEEIIAAQPQMAIINQDSLWETSTLRADFKMVKIPCTIQNPMITAQNITSGIIANPVFYVRKDEGVITVHTQASNHVNFYGNNKVEIHLTIQPRGEK